MPQPLLTLTNRLPGAHRRLLGTLLLISLLIVFWPGSPKQQSPLLSLMPVLVSSSLSQLEPQLGWHAQWQQLNQTLFPEPEPEVDESIVHYAIQSGDSLSRIFSRLGFSQQLMHRIMAADQSLLALDVLRPGHSLTFQLDDNKELLSMELFVHPGNRVLYQREEDGDFSYQELLDEGEWYSQTLVGEIHGSFYLSAQRAGLNDAEIATVSQLFRDRINFSRDIQAGARFQVIRSDNYVGEEATGQSRIEGIRLFNRRQQLTAFLHENGQYYDAEGNSLQRAFMRIPLQREFRISSAFNPRRLHPVTRRVSPHNGTDFATPTGTPVLAAADGVVIRVENHPFAGRYIEIQHHGQYKTRYLHLDRALVRNGQRVERGQRIALSGATGRVTGPHLHYELHVNNRPVNPMTANIPLAQPIPDEGREAFFEKVAFMIQQMDEETLLAQKR